MGCAPSDGSFGHLWESAVINSRGRSLMLILAKRSTLTGSTASPAGSEDDELDSSNSQSSISPDSDGCLSELASDWLLVPGLNGAVSLSVSTMSSLSRKTGARLGHGVEFRPPDLRGKGVEGVTRSSGLPFPPDLNPLGVPEGALPPLEASSC